MGTIIYAHPEGHEIAVGKALLERAVTATAHARGEAEVE